MLKPVTLDFVSKTQGGKRGSDAPRWGRDRNFKGAYESKGGTVLVIKPECFPLGQKVHMIFLPCVCLHSCMT